MAAAEPHDVALTPRPASARRKLRASYGEVSPKRHLYSEGATRLQVALDTAQQTGPDVFTRMNRHGRHTLTAFDAQMRAPLPALDTTEGPQNATKVLRGHKIRIADGLLICLWQ